MYFVFDCEQKNWFIRIKNVCYDTIVRKKYLFDNVDLQFEFCTEKKHIERFIITNIRKKLCISNCTFICYILILKVWLNNKEIKYYLFNRYFF